MSKFVPLLFCTISIFTATNYNYHGSTTAAVTLVGGVIATQHINIEKKYKRSECPVCKGRGYYISGDDISKVPCGYCEPDSKEIPTQPKTIIHRR